MKNKNGFATTIMVFSILTLIIFLISSVYYFAIKIKANNSEIIDRTNELLDNKNNIKKIVNYTK